MLSSINQLSISNQHRFRGQKQVRCHDYPYVCAISKLPQSVFRSIGINTTKYRPLVFGSIDPNTTVVFRSIHPNTSVVFRSIGPILNVVLRSNNVVSDVALRSIDVVFRSIDS